MGKSRQRNWGLQKKLTVVIFIAVTLVLFLSSTLFMAANYYFSNNKMKEDAESLVQSFAGQIQTAIIFDQVINVTEALDEILERPELIQASVYLKNGDIYASRGATKAVISFNETQLCSLGFFYTLALNSCYEVKDADETIAYIHLGFTRQALLDRLLTQILIFFVCIVISLLVSLIYAAQISRAIARPLNQLATLAKNVAKEKQFNLRGELTGTQEVMTLTQSFNQMLDEIEAKDAALQSYTQDLEQAVEERTASLNKALDEAKIANAAKSEFLANMSHELRTPLHGILSFSNLGVKKHTTARSDKLLQYFNRINASGNRLLALLNDLLDLSKLEAGKMVLDIKPTSLMEVLEARINEQSALIKEKQLNLIWDKQASDIEVNIDVARIGQVVTNLLSNAFKFTPEGKKIHIQCLRLDYIDQPAVQVVFQDEGIGIPADELESVFDKFIQSSKTKTNAGGTGLGLAICKEIIGLHNGKIWAESEPGEGARFSFVLSCDGPQPS
jgi:signal transduction histidine kinase